MQRLLTMLFYGELLFLFVLTPIGIVLFVRSTHPTSSVIRVQKPGEPEADQGQQLSKTQSPLSKQQRNNEEPNSWMSSYLEINATVNPYWRHVRYTKWATFLKTPLPVRIDNTSAVYISKAPSASSTHHLEYRWSSWADFRTLPLRVILLTIVYPLLTIVLTVVITYMGKRLFDGITQRGFFEQQQVSRLTTIGWLFMGYGLSEFIIHVLKFWYVRTALLDYGLVMSPTVRLGWGWPAGSATFFVGAVILTLAHVFTYGLQLRQEHELTI
ncbi:DUF2975 domain-containing protein [Spirosoma sordidisoli]|nr:DUF2975 domain-containing protein [Spirosoma sordidisoli]